MFIVDKVIQDFQMNDEDSRHDFITFGCVETYGYKKDIKLCNERNSLVGIETLDRCMDICFECWCREV